MVAGESQRAPWDLGSVGFLSYPFSAGQEGVLPHRDGDYGGAVLARLMGYVAGRYDMSRGFTSAGVLL